MTGRVGLLTESRGTAHAALVAGVLDAVREGGPGHAAPGPAEELSPSELRVLRYLPTYLARHEIAEQLSVSLNTVSTHASGGFTRSSAPTYLVLGGERPCELRLLAPSGNSRRCSRTASRGPDPAAPDCGDPSLSGCLRFIRRSSPESAAHSAGTGHPLRGSAGNAESRGPASSRGSNS